MSDLKIQHDDAINFEQKLSSSPYYSYTRVFPQNNQTSFQVFPASTQDVIFDLPTKVQNMSEHKITFDIDIPAQTAANNTVSLRLDAPPIQRLALYTRGGQYICDIQNFDVAWKMANLPNTKLDEFESKGNVKVELLSATSKASGTLLEWCNPVNAIAAAPVNAAGSVIFDNRGAKLTQGGTPSAFIGVRRQFYTKNQYSYCGGGANPANTQGVSCLLSFKEIPFCALNMNKDFYTSETLQLLVSFQMSSKWAFRSTDAADLSTGANNLDTPPTISNLTLFVACEENATIRDAVIQKWQSQGLNYIVPYTRVDINSLGVNTSASVLSKINVSSGQRLLRVLSAERNSVNSLNVANNFFNLGSVLTQSYFTTLDSVRLTPQDLSYADGTAVHYNKDKLKGSVCENAGEWLMECPVHVDDWSACNSLIEAREKDYHICGLDLSQERNYQKFVTKTATASDCVYVIVTQKTLTSTPMGVICQ